jgi:hypothetical protein
MLLKIKVTWSLRATKLAITYSYSRKTTNVQKAVTFLWLATYVYSKVTEMICSEHASICFLCNFSSLSDLDSHLMLIQIYSCKNKSRCTVYVTLQTFKSHFSSYVVTQPQTRCKYIGIYIVTCQLLCC